MKIAIASDHAGYEEKERLKPLLDELGIQYEDLGTVSEESVDYPDFARIVGIIDGLFRNRAEILVLNPEFIEQGLQTLFLFITGVIAGDCYLHFAARFLRE